MTEKAKTEPTFGRVFDAAVGADWAITEDGLRTVLAIASRSNPAEAVEAYRSEPHQHAPSLKVRNGVGIIPVTGPISRYMSWFSYFSGGTSISALARDLQTALDDPSVYSIMFEINSPGGEVTGVHEFAQMVYKARSQKPITARVGGLGCSAAYWIAAMCGDVVVDRTAQLGSIGVMAVYLDDRKQLEMRGLSEIEFISSQSPYKNAPPYEEEGKSRIQKRIDALAQVFVESVARGRGVSVKTVLTKFGQGDVFVGEAAIEAGLADRLGSFEETLDQLADTHTPGYFSNAPATDDQDDDLVPDEPDEDFDEELPYAEEKTINETAAVNSQPVHEAGDSAADDSNQNEEFMSEEKKDTTAAADNNQETAEQETPKAETPAASAPAASEQSSLKPESASNEDLTALKAELEKSKEKIAALEQSALDGWIDTTVANFAGETAANKAILSALVAANGKDSAEVSTFIENQKALTAQLEAGGLFKEIGKGADGTDTSAEAQLEAKAKALMAADPTLTIQQARTNAYEQNPDLYQAMQEGK